MQRFSNARDRFGRKNNFNNHWFKDKPSKSFRSSFSQRRFGNRKRFGEKIDISQMIRCSASEAPIKEIEIRHSFDDFNLAPQIRTNLKKRNFITPTPVQDQSIEPILAGKDLIGLANTGTGKTAAYLLPLIDKVSRDKSKKVLIIVPTRELAIQIEQEFREFSWGMQIFSAVCVGGAPIFKQIGNLRRNPNFVIGTPGRLKDLIGRGLIQLPTFQNVVIDEVDRMLDMGFIDDIREILSAMPKDRQSLFFSATVPLKIRDLVNQFSHDPITIEVKTGITAKNVDQDVIRVRDQAMKLQQLQELLSSEMVEKALIFIETKREVDKVTTSLIRGGFRAESIHGDKRQSQRQRSLTQFRNNNINILVATDVAARGLDIKDITHVINYTVPQTYDDYIHRIGRTGRGDNKGFAYTFVG